MAKAKNKTVYVCQTCGAQRSRWEGKCSDCGSWNSFVEETFSDASSGYAGKSPQRSWVSTHQSGIETVRLDQSLSEIRMKRMQTKISELDRVLGGGLAESSFVLLGGAPGIGKSTLLLQMAGGLAKDNHKVLYISAEESTNQSASRAHRLGIKNQSIEIASESNMNLILELAEKLKPDVLIVDSIQTVFVPEVTAAPGSVSQVREAAGQLMTFAKRTKSAVVLIGHITKDGHLAGPKVLEHMVDCVLSFEGDSNSHYRLLRTLKNRFGSAQELGVFEMVAHGLKEVTNPSELFLQERSQNRIGSSIFASLEGTRPILCEIQALTLNSNTSFPRRTSLGIDINRLHLLTAVMDRHLGIKLSFSDLYINVVGGLKIDEPGVDLAIAAAILSTDRNQAIAADALFLGEIGLTGEIRAITFPEIRIREAVKLGFKDFYLPHFNQKHFEDPALLKNIRVHFLKSVHDLNSLMK
jgi:DNA repair protein RadA/Sms